MKYWIEFQLRRARVDLPDDLDGEALEAALERAAADVDVEALVEEWDAGEDE